MAQARQESDWNHTAALLAMTANVNRPRNVRVFKPADFHPARENQRAHAKPQPLAKAEIGILKTIFVDRQL